MIQGPTERYIHFKREEKETSIQQGVTKNRKVWAISGSKIFVKWEGGIF